MLKVSGDAYLNIHPSPNVPFPFIKYLINKWCVISTLIVQKHILFWFVKLLKFKSVINNSVHYYILLAKIGSFFSHGAVIHYFSPSRRSCKFQEGFVRSHFVLTVPARCHSPDFHFILLCGPVWVSLRTTSMLIQVRCHIVRCKSY